MPLASLKQGNKVKVKGLGRNSSYPISTLPERLHSTLLRTPKLPEKTRKPKETRFLPPLTLVTLLASYPLPLFTPFTGSLTHTHPF